MTKRRGTSPLCTPHILSFPRKRESSRTRRVARAERNPPVPCLRSIFSTCPIPFSAQMGQPRIRQMRRYRALVLPLRPSPLKDPDEDRLQWIVPEALLRDDSDNEPDEEDLQNDNAGDDAQVGEVKDHADVAPG